MMRTVLLAALAALLCACGVDPMTSNHEPDADADAALPSLDGAYGGQWSFRARDLAPSAQPRPSGGGGGSNSMSVAGGVLDLSGFMPQCTVRVEALSPTLARVDAGAVCESNPRGSWMGTWRSARATLRPGATLAIGEGRITGALEWDWTGVPADEPGVVQTGVVTLALNLTRAP